MKTSIKNLVLVCALIVCLGSIPATQVMAQTLMTLHSFNGSDGDGPYCSLVFSGNGRNLYGTTAIGGSSLDGTVFAINTNATGFTTLHTFTNGSDGANPLLGGLVLSGETLYGTSRYGGTNGYGSVFAVNTDGTGFTPLYSFTAANAAGGFTNGDGATPYAGLVLSGETLYGTARYGGTKGYGTVFAVNTDGTGFTTLHNFTNGSDGANPWDGLVLSGKTLYGTAFYGGSEGWGSVFKVNTDGTGFTTLHSFSVASGPLSANSDGANPWAGLILSGVTLYGTAYGGGNSGYGTVFALSTNGTDFTTLYNFTGHSDGANPTGSLILLDDTLFGTAESGGSSGSGTVFAVSSTGTDFTTWHSFTGGIEGAYPAGGLIFSGTNLYGTTINGGASDAGTVFSLPVAFGLAPAISGQPQSQTAGYGQTATFRVYANGYPPMYYQWYFNGTNAQNAIMGATNAELTLANLTNSNAGCYTVAVTDPSGTTFSSCASLNLLPFVGIHLVPALSLYGVVGSNYEVQFINAFGPTNAPWTTLATVTLTTNGQFYPDYSAIGQPTRYYQIVQVP